MGFWFDWLRGFDESDARSLDEKLKYGKTLPPGSIVEITSREYKALQYFARRSNEKVT